MKHLRSGAPIAAAVGVVGVQIGIKTKTQQKEGEKEARLKFKAGSNQISFCSVSHKYPSQFHLGEAKVGTICLGKEYY